MELRSLCAVLALGLVYGTSADAQETDTSAGAEASTETTTDAGPPSRTFEQYAAQNTATGGAQPWRQITQAELLEPEQTYPYVEWHGYYRFRADSFWNLDLDTAGTSPILPPIEALIEPGTDTSFSDSELDSPVNEDGSASDIESYANSGAEHLGGANMRLRLHPIFHVTERARIHTELNLLDNVVLGSTPDGFNEADLGNGLRTDMPIIGFSGSQEPPNQFSAGRESITVTQLYGEVNAFFGTLRLGRMASHWGLGILANGGGSYSSLREPRYSYRGVSMAGHGCLDCDFGDYVDRAMFITNLFDTYVALAWDYNYSGPLGISADQYWGQPRELSNYDDVRSYVISIFQRPLREEEIAMRNRQLKEERRPAFDWGMYFVYRVQKLTAEGFNALEQANDYTWWPRGARAAIPDLWLRYTHEPSFGRRIRLEGEFAAILGSIDNANPNPGNPIRQRDIRQFGGAVEFEYINRALATGLNTGFATGRTIEEGDETPIGFGVIDEWSVSDQEPVLTNFKFDRNYFVDSIMFREVVGAITNAVYFNPFFQYDLFAKQDDTLGVRLDLITANAMDATTTPSGESFYGVETDVSVYWREPRYGTDITAGVYIPGSVFDGVAGRPRLQSVGNSLGRFAPYAEDVNATPAWTLQGRFFWAF